MGSWGEKPFDNDVALDLFEEIETGGVTAIRDLLAEVAETDDEEYLDVDDGSGAIAAAEIVAAAFGKSRARVSSRLAAWLEANRGAIGAADVAVAKQAVARVLGEQSELRGLWEDGGGPRNPWRASVDALLARLDEAAAIAGPVKASAIKKKAAGDKPVGKHEKEGLVAFLRMRGLEPTAAQLKRIEGSRDRAEIRSWLRRAVDVRSVAELLDGER